MLLIGVENFAITISIFYVNGFSLFFSSIYHICFLTSIEYRYYTEYRICINCGLHYIEYFIEHAASSSSFSFSHLHLYNNPCDENAFSKMKIVMTQHYPKCNLNNVGIFFLVCHTFCVRNVLPPREKKQHCIAVAWQYDTIS